MGATNLTPNYELSQFIGTDKPAWLQDYNGDMLKIDTAIAGAKTAADNAQSAADGAQGDATSALSSISDINTELGTVETTLSSATGNINTINSLIGNGLPTTTDKTIIGAINELHTDEIALEGAVAPISGAYVYRGNYNSSITADGVKDYKTLLNELASQAKDYVHGLDSTYRLKPLLVYISTIGGFTAQAGNFIDNNSEVAFEACGIDASSGHPVIKTVRPNSAGVGYNYLNTCVLEDTPATTITILSDVVPASGTSLAIQLEIYKINS